MTLTTDIDKVRLLCGDTNESDPLLYDDEITACLAQRVFVSTTAGTVYNHVAAAADACGAIAAKFGRDFSFGEDGQRFDRAQRVGHYQALERSLRARQGGVSVPVSIAGTAYST
jgi:hypothetical protein